MERIPFGVLPDGTEAELCTIASAKLRVTVSTLGATVVGISLPDCHGVWEDVALGFDAPEEYMTQPGNLGATIGRYAGRIAGGQFPLNGKTVRLDRNRGRHTIHGGPVGFHQKLWTVAERGEQMLELELVSPDGDQGFPGQLTSRVRFSLEEDTLVMDVWARSDADTVCSLTSHTYWNLAGHDRGTIDGHILSVAAESCLETDADTIPTGAYSSLAGTVLDLRQPALLRGIEADHTFVLRTGGVGIAARLEDPKSGRWMELSTDLPGLQVYTSDHLPDGMPGKSGAVYGPRHGVCLEPQLFPDAPNHPHFPSALLRAGEELRHQIRWRFGAKGTSQSAKEENLP